MLLNISNIQHYSTGDGEGIRTTVFFKGCSLRCPWCHNPEGIEKKPVELNYKNGRREIAGRLVEARIAADEVLWDRDFYEESGGGATLSGGEVLLQADGAAELCAYLRNEGVSVFIDTAGAVPFTEIEKVLPFADAFLYDLKTADEKKFADVCRGDLMLVISNLRSLLNAGADVRIRIPLIPGFNTDEDDIDGICELLDGLGITKVDLLPFHRLGSAKYEALGLAYAYSNVGPLGGKELERIASRCAGRFSVRIEK